MKIHLPDWSARKQYQRPSNFSFYNGEQISSPLSSFALKKFFNNEPKVKLFYPISLPLNRKLLESK